MAVSSSGQTVLDLSKRFTSRILCQKALESQASGVAIALLSGLTPLGSKPWPNLFPASGRLLRQSRKESGENTNNDATKTRSRASECTGALVLLYSMLSAKTVTHATSRKELVHIGIDEEKGNFPRCV